MSIANRADEARLSPLAVSEVDADASRQTYNGGRNIRGFKIPDPTEISAAIDAVDLVTLKTALLSRRMARAFCEAMAASEAASDLHASSLVLSDHIDTNHPSTAVRAGRARKHTDALRGQDTEIFRAVLVVRAVANLDNCTERSRKALNDSIHMHAALDAAIQADDGDISLTCFGTLITNAASRPS